MRISTNEFLLGALPELLAQQSNLNQLNREIASGQTMLDATSDPAGAGLAMQTAGEIQQLTYDAGNAQAGAQSIQTTVGALEQVSTVIDQLRQVALTAANGTTTDDTRQSLVAEAQSALQQLIQLANTQDASGNYVFAGSDMSAAPFTMGADGQVSFKGDAATNSVEIAPGLAVPVTASGQGIFVNIPAGNDAVAVTAGAANSGGATALVQGVTSLAQVTSERLAGTQYEIEFSHTGSGGGGGGGSSSLGYTVVSGRGSPGSAGFAASSGVVASGGFAAGQDLRFGGVDLAIDGTPAAGDNFVVTPAGASSLFQTVQDLITALGTPQQAESPGTDWAQQQIQNAIGNLDGAQNAVLSAEATLGSGLSEIQAVQGQDQTQSTSAQAQLSDLQSANLPEVMANYSAGVTALQAAEVAFARIQNLSLFSVIQP